jgi:hypothetical protein
MDLRRYPRFDANQEVIVTLRDEPMSPIGGRVIDFSEHGVRLSIPERLPIRSLVRIEWRGALLLGEVTYCRPEEDTFIAGCEVEEVLSKSELMKRPKIQSVSEIK